MEVKVGWKWVGGDRGEGFIVSLLMEGLGIRKWRVKGREGINGKFGGK